MGRLSDCRHQLTASRARLLTEADAPRRRIVRDLRDGAQERLVHTSIRLGLAQRELKQDDQGAQALTAEALGRRERVDRPPDAAFDVRDDGTGGADPGGRGPVGIEDRVTALGGQ